MRDGVRTGLGPFPGLPGSLRTPQQWVLGRWAGVGEEAAVAGVWGRRRTSRVQRLAGFSTKNLRRMLSQSVDM